jgi:hypothetical protein
VATAASTALPPRARVAALISEAKLETDTTIPRRAGTALFRRTRRGEWCRSRGPLRECRWRGDGGGIQGRPRRASTAACGEAEGEPCVDCGRAAVGSGRVGMHRRTLPRTAGVASRLARFRHRPPDAPQTTGSCEPASRTGSRNHPCEPACNRPPANRPCELAPRNPRCESGSVNPGQLDRTPAIRTVARDPCRRAG